MQFTVSAAVLSKELAFVLGAVERKNTIPVLTNLLLESTKGLGLRLTGTDLDVTLRCDFEAEDVAKDGAICVPARKLSEIVRLADSDLISFKVEKEAVGIKCGQAKFKIPMVARDAFPELPAMKDVTAQLPSAAFRTMIERTSFAITQEESRYTLGGAKCEVKDGLMKLITTDGHRLAYIAHAADKGVTLDVMIPRKALGEAAKLAKDHEGTLGLAVDDNHLYLNFGKRSLVSRLLFGQFPNYEMVIPKDSTHSVTVEAALLQMAVKRAALMADEKSHAVRVHFGDNELVVSAQSADVGEGSAALQCTYADAALDIGFNSQYLQEFLGVVREGEVIFRFKDGNSQGMFELVVAGDFDYKYIVMPLRL